ncbi:MAG TPA: phosphate ABC transporter permease PstA [Geobacterales bacterium]|jgi:phosphate transport system permease protein|nr:phosphate ABC transporter permease PstA [Geobacterales bacterium]
MTTVDARVDADVPRESEAHETDPFHGVDFSKLERSLRKPRTFVSSALSGIATAMTVFALIPLFSVLGMLLWRGGRELSIAAFTQLPPAPLELGGGFGNAIVGTLVMVGMALLISLPVGIMSAIFLAQSKPDNYLAATVRFVAKVLTGFPSVLAGVFAYGAVVLVTGGYSALAGAVALSILMVPTILLTAEDAIRMVPKRMKEAAIGIGATDTQTVWMVLLPTALPGILTGVMLAVARGAGETAPLLFTALFSNYWILWHGHLKLMEPTASLAVLIYNFSGMPFPNQVELAWAAALVLVLLVLAANLIGQSLSHRQVQ